MELSLWREYLLDRAGAACCPAVMPVVQKHERRGQIPRVRGGESVEHGGMHAGLSHRVRRSAPLDIGGAIRVPEWGTVGDVTKVGSPAVCGMQEDYLYKYSSTVCTVYNSSSVCTIRRPRKMFCAVIY